jgi:glycosyltransferase involved in cell wall biosynthesis
MAATAARSPTVSVIVPLYNAERLIASVLAPLRSMLARGELTEVLVVDDGSVDGSVAVVQQHVDVTLLRRHERGGPGAARNSGAQRACGEYLWFVDSDVIVADDAARVLSDTLRQSSPHAVIGSYDDTPAARNFLSQYKNLVHAYYHRRGRRDASTFWSGCGAVRRDVFLSLDGFDAMRYPYPSIEDIELGYRIVAAGGRIVLEPALQGKHLKQWRLVNLLHTEVFRRAIPWSLLMLERKALTNDLNVSRSERLRAVLAALCALSVPAAIASWAPFWAPAALIGATAVANRELIAFFAARRGTGFALRAFFFHQIYYLYSTASFAAAAAMHQMARLAGRRPANSTGGERKL